MIGRTLIVFSLCAAVVTSAAIALQEGSRADTDLLNARRQVWEAYFRNDQRALLDLVPEGTIVGNQGADGWQTRSDLLRGADEFARHHGHLVSLDFTDVHIQHFGNVALVYSKYRLTAETEGQRFDQRGRAMEAFVLQGGHWQNPGWEADLAQVGEQKIKARR